MFGKWSVAAGLGCFFAVAGALIGEIDLFPCTICVFIVCLVVGYITCGALLAVHLTGVVLDLTSDEDQEVHWGYHGAALGAVLGLQLLVVFQTRALAEECGHSEHWLPALFIWLPPGVLSCKNTRQVRSG